MRMNTKSGINVSTVFTPDCGYETALIDLMGTYPVERYGTKAEAKNGHIKWFKFAETANGKTVTRLGLGSLIDDKNIILKGY